MSNEIKGLREALFPEVGAGGFTRRDGIVDFYFRCQTLASSMSTRDRPIAVIDVGAGPAVWWNGSDVHRRLRDLRGPDRYVIGIDVDPRVRENPSLDEARIISPDLSWPLEDQSADFVVANATLEHVEDPAAFVKELVRVLRPGGWACFRTPNKWGVVGMAARAVPNRRHESLLAHLQPTRPPEDIYPVTYRLNTLKEVEEALSDHSTWNFYSYYHTPEPNYLMTRPALARIFNAVVPRLPRAMGTSLHIFAQRTSGQ